MIQPYALYSRLTLDPKTERLKVKGWKKACNANNNQNKTDMALLTLEKIKLSKEDI